ncbi:hypothetical protein GYO_3050 [Bacillus spizizenii TU-B-10]|uniref:Uncharacterized protein n=1 Tax=Bacillus spizizenii (strain DSM 15029 / JCM 12233 / NBRC 101239 / NRRL B-23049 / TU-B-10) TaxID=1052585 RepID=G4NYE5_BACS4|nr:hypothetical protein GYO_3050 [Bacillus spizizenii TU-B-10]
MPYPLAYIHYHAPFGMLVLPADINRGRINSHPVIPFPKGQM